MASTFLLANALAESARLASALASLSILSWGVYKFVHRKQNEEPPPPVSSRRGNFRAAVVDDDVASRFDPVAREALRGRGFNVDYFADISNVRELDRYSIVLCDIKGVGRHMGLDGNGHGGIIVSELRKSHPLIYIVMYSAENYNPRFNRFFALADEVMDKGSVSGEAVVELLDRAIAALGSASDLWKRFKKHVLARLPEEIDAERIRRIQRGFMKVANDGEAALNRKLTGLVSSGLPSEDSATAELTINASEAADKLIELFS
jgi:hypothetical protein